MNLKESEFLKYIKLLHDNHCLEHVMLIGSWVEFIYKENSIMPNFEPQIKTLDVDFLVKNLKKPFPPQNIAILSRSEGYYVNEDLLNGTTKILDKDGLEIEFLINKKGAGEEMSLKTNLGVKAQSLRHLNILSDNPINLKFFEIEITVPQPEAYAIHKMVINDQRENKREKDANAIKNIYPFLNVEKFDNIFLRLSKKEKRKVEEFKKSLY